MSRGPTSQQKHALGYVARYETAHYGVIVREVTGLALIRRGFCVDAARRRTGGQCVRLTDAGRKEIDA